MLIALVSLTSFRQLRGRLW